MTIARATGKAAPYAGRIAIILHDFSGGGSERIAIRLANAWATQGRRVTILCGSEAGPARALVDPAVAVLGLRPALPRGAFSRIRLGQAIAPYIRLIEPDLIFGPGNFHLPVLRAMAVRLPRDRPPIACKLSNPLERAGRGPMAQRLFERATRITTGPVDSLVTMSESLRDEATRILRRPDIACITEPNLDDATPPPVASVRTVDILCIGRLAPQKRFDLALQAFALLPTATGATLTLLGDGPERARLIGEAQRLGIADRVRFAGHVADVAPYLAEARMLLCTSLFEGYPAVLIEALAARVAVVTTDCSPAIPEIMAHPSFGIVAARDDAATIAKAMLAQLTDDLPEEMAARRLAARHAIGPVSAAYLALFDRTVAARHGG